MKEQEWVTVKKMKILGGEFVFAQTIEDAVARSEPDQLYSYDMLGEVARDKDTAHQYFESFLHAIEFAGANVRREPFGRLSVSIKLSALHPRCEFAQRQRLVRHLPTRCSIRYVD